MDREKEVYLDNAGSPRPSSKLLRSVFEDLERNALGNPHSGGSAEAILTEARALTLNHFGASSDEYDCVFTSGSTAGLKMVGELFPFGEHGYLIHSTSVHTSLLGIRGYSGRTLNFDSKLLYDDQVGHSFHCNGPGLVKNVLPSEGEYHLFATSGECNFSGAKINLRGTSELYRKFRYPVIGNDIYEELIKGGNGGISCEGEERSGDGGRVQSADKCVKELPWMWLLDAAKLASTSPICLSDLPPGGRPDFVTVSFYKMFGYPTGLGALLVRKERSALLRGRKKYFGGGSVHAVAATSHFTVPRELPHEYMEDGTVHFQGISALRLCFQELEREGGMQTVAIKTGALCASLEDGLRALRHRSGEPLCELYTHPVRASASAEKVCTDVDSYIAYQGPTLALNLRWADGSPVGHNTVRRLASQPKEGPRIFFRSGCFCNIGGCQEALSLSHEEIERNFRAGRYCWSDEVDLINGSRSGALRVSLGRQSSEEDVAAFLVFLRVHFLDRLEGGDTIDGGEGHRAVKALEAVAESVPPPVPGTNAVLSSMYVYPIKSAGGMRVPRWLLQGGSGLVLDREWVVCDTRNGRAVTLKTSPQLCLLRTRICRVSPRSVLINPASASGGVVVVVEAPLDCLGGAGSDVARAKSCAPLVLPVAEKVAKLLLEAGCVPEELPPHHDMRGVQAQACGAAGYSGDDHDGHSAEQRQGQGQGQGQEQEPLTVRICADRRRALATARDADLWFSSFLGFPCRLLRTDDSNSNSNSNSNSGSGSGRGESRVKDNGPRSFSNEAPLLVVSGSSMRQLREAMRETETRTLPNNPQAGVDVNPGGGTQETPGEGAGGHTVDVLNFRPNLVVEGRPGLEEAHWQGIRLSPLSIKPSSSLPLLLRVDKPCERCSVINVNPKTGVMEGRALSTLATFNPVGGSNCFGLFVSVVDGEAAEEGGKSGSEVACDPRRVWLLQEASAVDVHM